MVFCAGQVGLDPDTGTLVEGDIAAQTERALQNLKAVLEGAGSGLDQVVKTTVFMTDLGEFAAMNEVYADLLHERPAGPLHGAGRGPAGRAPAWRSRRSR